VLIDLVKLRFDAKITLLLREQDVQLLLKAVQQLTAENEEEASNRRYLLDILGYLALPD
jgi:hypothetical protein